MKSLKDILESSMIDENTLINEDAMSYKKEYNNLLKVKINPKDVDALAAEIHTKLLELDTENGSSLQKGRLNLNYDTKQILKILDIMKKYFQSRLAAYEEAAAYGWDDEEDEDEYAPSQTYCNCRTAVYYEKSGPKFNDIDEYLAYRIFEVLYSRQFGDMNDTFYNREGDRPRWNDDLEEYDNDMDEWLGTLF